MNKEIDIVCLGEALIDFFAVQTGVYLPEVDSFKKAPGGAPANVAVGCAKLGLKTSFFGRVGDDEFGRFLAGILEGNSVDISQLQYDNNIRTGLAFISLPTPNTREFLFYRNPSADMYIDHKEFDNNILGNTIIFHFGSITLIEEPSRTSTYKAVEVAKSNNATISYDPNLREMLWPSLETAEKTIRDAVSFADIIKCTDNELRLITGEDDIQKGMEKILLMGPRICITTMGENGSFYATKKFFGKVEAFKADTVDASGCGDSFVAGILYNIIKKGINDLLNNERILIEALEFSSAAAALTSTRKGVVNSLPSKKEIEKFLLKYK